jgi:hypothetical protein
VSWSKFEVSQRQLTHGDEGRILRLFAGEFVWLGMPDDMAMFTVERPGQEFSSYYLSPATAWRAPMLLRTLNAQPSDAPPDDARSVVAHEGKRPRDL